MFYKVPKKYRLYLEEAIKITKALQAQVEDDLFPESGVLKPGLDEDRLQDDFNRYSILLELLRDLQRKALKGEDLSFMRNNLRGIHDRIDSLILVIEPVRRFKVSKPVLHQYVLDKSFRAAMAKAKTKDAPGAANTTAQRIIHH